MTDSTLSARFWAKVDRDTTPDGCWLWLGYCQPNGYPKFNDGRSWYAHRAAWEMVNGPIPEGLTIDHLCNTPRCVRLEHLRLATQAENIARSHNHAAQAREKTHCVHGHTLADAYIDRRGRRACRECNRLNARRQRVRAKALRARSIPMTG